MPCENYKPSLIEAAASDAKLSGALHAHVESCASCNAELAQQRLLVAAIGANLHRQMNAPVSTAVLLRLEARLAQEATFSSTPAPRLHWLYTAAATATAGAVILFAMPHLRTHKPNPRTVALSKPAPSQTAPSTTDYRPQIVPIPLKPSVQLETRRPKRYSQSVATSQPEILVPPDEQIALTRFIARRNARREFVVALAAPVHQGLEPTFKDLEIPEINTAEIVIEPIATGASR